MIRRFDDFKKDSDKKEPIKKMTKKDSTINTNQEVNTDLPGNPNLPIDDTKVEQPIDTSSVRPDNAPEGEVDVTNSQEDIKMIGKLAKFPKNTKASKAYNFLENVKISKNNIWYIMVEKQDDELQMIKYNYKKGVNLVKFVNELKNYYKTKFTEDNISESINNIYVDGTDKYSTIKNIPLVEVGGRKLISIITEDLIKLLSK